MISNSFDWTEEEEPEHCLKTGICDQVTIPWTHGFSRFKSNIDEREIHKVTRLLFGKKFQSA